MTLILTVNGPEAIWLMADRRLTRPGGGPLRDDARKLMFVENDEDVSILGYAGLGATAAGTEPADWMSAVLRGRRLSIEDSIKVMAAVVQRELPRHLIRAARHTTVQHAILIPAIVNREARFYTIDLVLGPRGHREFRLTRRRAGRDGRQTPRFGIGGSGATRLLRDRRWARPLLRLVKAHDRGQISAEAVADHLAAINYRVSGADATVGPRCIVAWRFRRNGVQNGGGSQMCYTDKTRESGSPNLPCIGNGIDLAAVADITMKPIAENLEAFMRGEYRPSTEEINAALAKLPEGPDERLK